MISYDLAIIGGGPAGVAAGVYAARKQLKTIYITSEWGGQSVVSEGIENWIGTVKIPGTKLADDLRTHLEAYAADVVEVKSNEWAEKVEKTESGFKTKTSKGEYESRAILIATGSARRKLPVPGADTFEHKGLTYCASCDGPIFAGQDVAVIGGGNAAFESAAQLMAYCKSVTILNRSDSFKADPVTVARVSANPKVKVLTNAVPAEVKGDQFVSSIVYEDKASGEKHELPVAGIFVEIGSIPNSDLVKGLVELDERGEIKVDPRNQQTSVPGIWAAGDVTDGLYHQNNIAAGDAVKALEDIYLHIHTR